MPASPVLESDREESLRRRMLDEIQANPGISLSDLADELEVHPSTIRYHGRALEDGGQVKTIHEGQFLLHFPRRGEDSPTGIRDIATAIRGKPRKRILRLLCLDPCLTISEAARRLDRHPSSVQRHIDVLVEREILVDVRDAGKRRVQPAEEAEPILRDLLF